MGLMDGMTVNHKDGDKTNNSITNLEFMSASENTSHSFKSGNRKSCCHPVEFDGVFYYSKREFERKTGIPRKTKIGEMQCR